MIEVDHLLLINAEQPPEPARPILATHLLELEEIQRKRFAEGGRSERVQTGCGEIDELLGGGFERGILVGVSADGNVGRLISFHLLASILISHLASSATTQPSKAVVIDTTGSFPLPLLAKVLKSRIINAQDQSVRAANQTANYQLPGRGKGKQPSSDVDDDVQKCLEMVALSRVFDIEGLWEVLGEVRRDIDSETPNEVASVDGGPSNDQAKQQAQEINDSQEESVSSEDETTSNPPLEPENRASGGQGTEIIVIDNMTHIINELFARKEKGDAHTLLSLLSQSLYTLSSTQNIVTVLHNTAVSSKSTYNQAPTPNAQVPAPEENRVPVLPKSIFPSNPLKPGLGQIFAPFPALHLFLSSLPKSRADADILYGQDDDSMSLDTESVEYCTVLEVLKDEAPILGTDKEKGRRFGWREQRWTALEIDTEGTGLVCAFQAKRNMRGLAMEREKFGGLTDVGKMVKVHGFGGRRI